MLQLMQQMATLIEQNKNVDIDPAEKARETASMWPGARVSATGGIQGTVEKYPIDPSYYPNPLDRLYDDPAFKRHALRDNYLLTFNVEGLRYETADKLWYTEPQFTVELYRYIFDDDDNPTGQVARISRTIFLEDEFYATIVADKMGILSEFSDRREMMNEIRYVTIKNWLIGMFTKPHLQHFKKQPREMVIDGKVVEVRDTEDIISKDDLNTKAASVRQSIER